MEHVPWSSSEGSSCHVISLIRSDDRVRDLVGDLVPDDLCLKGCKIRADRVVEGESESIVLWAG